MLDTTAGKTAVLLAGLTFLFSSCGKSNSDNGAYHITCNIDGVASTFNTGALGHIDVDAGTANRALTINGLTATSSTAGNMGFVITNVPSGDSIAAGTYLDTATRFEVLASYDNNIADLNDFEAGTSTYQEAVRAGSNISNHFMITIVAGTVTTVKGTFSGDFYQNGDAKGTKKSITNGDFYVKLQ